jgi:hypothetical protein
MLLLESGLSSPHRGYNLAILMWTRRIFSGTQEFPTPQHVVHAVLTNMIVRAVSSSWAHFEIHLEHHWVKHHLFGRALWAEVAYVDEHTLRLNLGSPTRMEVPKNWSSEGRGLWAIPVSDVVVLTDWISAYLKSRSNRTECRISGWVDGL